jgi:uncharacterized protein (TIGR03437 family)
MIPESRSKKEMSTMKLWRNVTVLAVLGVCASGGEAQTPAGSVLRVEVENQTVYVLDCPNAQLASTTTRLNRADPKTFESSINIGDIVSVNGTAVKGSVFESILAVGASPTSSPGRAIADTTHNGLYLWNLEFLNLDNTPIGAIQVSGLAGGTRPPGYPPEIARNGAYIVTGGTGAFFGVRGYWQADIDSIVPVRTTSACEDPAQRRANGGGKLHGILYLVPSIRPEIVITPSGPAVVHSTDFTPVTATRPARAGEILTVFATGLGPTRPGVDPGQPFPASPLQVVNSPVEVVVNGQTSPALYAGGYPSAVDGYQINFRMPDGMATGTISVQLKSAWIAGSEIKIAVGQ